MTEAVSLVRAIRMLGWEGIGEGPELSAAGYVELLPCTGAGELGIVGLIEAAGVEAGGATHFVQIVDVTVLKIVDTVKVLWTIKSVPDFMVFVTGQVVTVVRTLRELLALHPLVQLVTTYISVGTTG